MEDIKAYIESGVLELYVLGDISAEERLRVEAMASAHDDVRAELEEIERAMTMYAEVNQVEPEPHLRSRVLNSLLTNLADDNNLKTVQHNEHRLRAIPVKRTGSNSFYKYAFAASILLLCVSMAALAMLYKRLQTSQRQLLSLTLNNQKFTRQVNIMDEELSVYRDSSYHLIRLRGTDNSPQSALTVAWSPKNKKVLIDLYSAKLPVTDKEHQYQLWAIAGKKPVDLGVFDADTTNTADMKPMKPAATAEAFAVTIEPRGGSVNPTMNQMVVMASL